MFSDVGSPRRRRHEERSDEVALESAHTPQGVYFVPVLTIRSIAKQWHEPRRGEVVPERMLLHSSFSLVTFSGENPHPNDRVGENEVLFLDFGSPLEKR